MFDERGEAFICEMEAVRNIYTFWPRSNKWYDGLDHEIICDLAVVSSQIEVVQELVRLVSHVLPMERDGLKPHELVQLEMTEDEDEDFIRYQTTILAISASCCWSGPGDGERVRKGEWRTFFC